MNEGWLQRQEDQQRIRQEIQEGRRPVLARRVTTAEIEERRQQEAEVEKAIARAAQLREARETTESLLPPPDQLLDEYARGKKDGLTYQQMADDYGVSSSLVARYVKRAVPPGMKVKDYLPLYMRKIAAEETAQAAADLVRYSVDRLVAEHGAAQASVLLAELLVATSEQARDQVMAREEGPANRAL